MQSKLVKMIKKEMVRRRITQLQVCNDTGIAPTSMSRIMTGKIDPRLTTIIKIMRALQIEFAPFEASKKNYAKPRISRETPYTKEI